MPMVASGKHTKNYGKIHHFKWENQRTEWMNGLLLCGLILRSWMINDLGLMWFRAKNSCLCLVSWMYHVDGWNCFVPWWSMKSLFFLMLETGPWVDGHLWGIGGSPPGGSMWELELFQGRRSYGSTASCDWTDWIHQVFFPVGGIT